MSRTRQNLQDKNKDTCKIRLCKSQRRGSN